MGVTCVDGYIYYGTQFCGKEAVKAEGVLIPVGVVQFCTGENDPGDGACVVDVVDFQGQILYLPGVISKVEKPAKPMAVA